MRSAREDAASASLPSQAMIVLGGLINGSRVATVEQLSHDGTWSSGLDLPEARDDRHGWQALHDHRGADELTRAQTRGHLTALDTALS